MNEGCIPSKTLLRSAEVAALMRRAAEFGVPVQEVAVDMPTVVNRKEMLIRGIREGLYRNIANNSAIKLVEGEARFKSPVELEIGDTLYQADKSIIAAGSRIGMPSIEGLDEVDYLTSREGLDLRYVPSSMIIVGGGYVALEFAQMYNSFGSHVTLLGRNPQIAPGEDTDIANALADIMREDGVELYTNAPVNRIYEEHGTKVTIAEIDGEEREFRAESLLIATGRTPNGDQLALENTDAALNSTAIETDEQLRTGDPHIWALGDVTGGYMFTHMATAEGPYAALNAVKDAGRVVDYRVVPRAIFTNPAIASVGLTEQEARDAGHDVSIGLHQMEWTGRARANGESRGLIKAIADNKDGRILGFHILAAHADDLIHEAVIAMNVGDGTLENITRSIHIHPTLGEAVKDAAKRAR